MSSLTEGGNARERAAGSLGKKIPGDVHCRRRNLFPSEHTGNFPYPVFAFEKGNPGPGLASFGDLPDQQVMVSLSGDLVQVGDSQDLSTLADFF